MNVLITGGTGFVGQNIAKAYLKAGHHVFVTGREAPATPEATEDKSPETVSNGNNKPAFYGTEDTEDKSPETVDNINNKPAFSGTECVFLGPDFQDIDFDQLPPIDIVNHQAAITDPQHPDEEEVWKVNFTDAIAFFQQAANHGVKKIVYASSAAVYGMTPPPFNEDGPFDPLTAYGYSKLALDMLSGGYLPRTVSIVGLRYSNVWGPGEDHKGKLASQVRQIGLRMMNGQRPKLFKYGEQRRDFVHVDDVVRANVLAGELEGRHVLNVGLGDNVSFNDIVAFWNQELGTDLEPEWIDNPFTGTYQAETKLDISKASALGWEPRIKLAGPRLTTVWQRNEKAATR